MNDPPLFFPSTTNSSSTIRTAELQVLGCCFLLLLLLEELYKFFFLIQKSRVMAAMSSLKNFPAGYRLNPIDDDLINHHLNRKLKGIPESDGNCYIPELDIYSYHPQDLVPEYDKRASINSNGLECFFFCTLDKDPNRRCNNRKIADGKQGFWHQTGAGRLPQPTDKNPWAKRIFSHRLGKQRNSEPTDWVMHEFRLISDERFVLCRITKKPKKKFSASAVKKRKDDSIDDNEPHQQTSTESCVLNDIIAKKGKNHTGESQDHNQFLQEASSEASSSSPEMNTAEASNFWIALRQMADTLTPESDINVILQQL